MADMRRRSPEPPPEVPQIQLKPGLANEMPRELAPLLAEEGIDVDNIDVPELDTLKAAMNRAVERHNMAHFTPVGQARDLAVTMLRLAIEAIAEDNTPSPQRSSNKCSLNPRTTPSPPSPAASALPSDCSTTGSPAVTRKHRQTSASASDCQSDTGSANAPRPTSWSWPEKDARSARSTR